MFFSAYLGNNANMLLWQQVICRHATWLGMIPHTESRTLDDGSIFSFCWLKLTHSEINLHVKESQEYLIINTSGNIGNDDKLALWEQPSQGRLKKLNTNEIHIRVWLQSGELKIVVPATTPQQFFYAKDSRGYVFGDDMRLLIRWAGLNLDEHAVYGLFEYGAIPPPFTMSKNVRRIPNGHLFKVLPTRVEPILEPFFQPVREPQGKRESLSPEMRIQDTLDGILAQVPEPAVLYFSGGVDSGLLASRMVQMGRKDIRLFNYAFGPNDQEGQLAMKMASHLGLICEQIMYESSDIHLMLERIGKDYSFPFGDRSVIPTNLLVHGSLGAIDSSQTVIEGTGADGAFGLEINPRWKQIYSLPSSIRSMISGGYKRLRLWRYDSIVERYGRMIRQSVQLPVNHAEVIGQCSLAGIAYNIPGEIRRNLRKNIRDRIEALGAGLGARDQCMLLDLIHICAGRYTAKSFDPLRTRGIKPIYPFLEPPMLNLSLSLKWDEKCKEGQSKSLLKKLLAHSVPMEMIYRPKSTFEPPFREMLRLDSMQDFLRNVVLSKENPLINFCRKDTLIEIIERVEKGQSLSDKGVFRFLWALMFTSGWLRQLEL